MSERYSGTYDALLLTLNPKFDPRRPSPKEKELYVSAYHDWVKFDDLERVPRYLETLSVDERDSRGNTALHFCKSVAMLDLLLARGADVFAKNCAVVPPIAFCSSLEVFKKLLEKMRSIDSAGTPDLNDKIASSGLTFFQLLVGAKSFDVIQWLLEDGNAQTLGLSTPQLYYFVSANLDTMRIAIQSDAPRSLLKAIHDSLPGDYAFDDFQLLCISAVYGGSDGIKFFAEKTPDVNREFSDGKVTAIMISTSFLNVDATKTLLELGANPNKVCGKGCCSAALGMIIDSKKNRGNVPKVLALLELLAEHGATFSERFKDGNNLLSSAVDADHRIFDFVASKAPTSAFCICVSGRKLIHLAAKQKSSEPLKALFKYSNVNFKVNEMDLSNSRETPLFIAAKSGSRECCVFLLENGANPDIKVDGISGSDIARRLGHNALADELRTFETEEAFCCF